MPTTLTAAEQRKIFLISSLRKLGVTQTPDGRDLKQVSLYTLEWNYAMTKYKQLNEGNQ